MNTTHPTLTSLRPTGPLSTTLSLLLFGVILCVRLSASWLSLSPHQALAEPLGELDAPDHRPCGQDHFEPNDVRGRARNISPSLFGEREVEATSCRGDEDWYTIWLTRGQLVELRLEGDEVGRWPGMDIYAPRKRKPQGVRRRGHGVQTLKIYAQRSGRYRLKVRGRGEQPARYRLQLRQLIR